MQSVNNFFIYLTIILPAAQHFNPASIAVMQPSPASLPDSSAVVCGSLPFVQLVASLHSRTTGSVAFSNPASSVSSVAAPLSSSQQRSFQLPPIYSGQQRRYRVAAAPLYSGQQRSFQLSPIYSGQQRSFQLSPIYSGQQRSYRVAAAPLSSGQQSSHAAFPVYPCHSSCSCALLFRPAAQFLQLLSPINPGQQRSYRIAAPFCPCQQRSFATILSILPILPVVPSSGGCAPQQRSRAATPLSLLAAQSSCSCAPLSRPAAQ